MSASIALAACATKLDFDAVSKGAEAERAPTDGGQRKPVLDAAVAEVTDAGLPPPRAPQRDAETWTQPTPQPVQDASGPVSPSLGCSAIEPVPYFCDDFSQPDLQARWTFSGIEPADAGALQVDYGAADASWLRSEIHAGVMNTCRDCIRARVQLELPQLLAPTRIVIELDLMVPRSDPALGRRIALLLLAFDDDQEQTASLQTLELESAGSGVDALFTESLPADVSTLTESGRFPVALRDRWMHLRYELEATDIHQVGAPFSLRLDDTVLATGRLGYALGGSQPYLTLGIPWLDSSQLDAQTLNGGWSALYDDVVVRVEAL